MEFNVADSQDNVNALGIAHWIFLPPTVIAPKYLYLKCEKKSVQVNSYDE